MSNGVSHFVVDFGWGALLKELGISAQDVLRRAGLPLDLFTLQAPTLTAPEFMDLWDAILTVANDPQFPLKMGQAFSADMFSPPLFACFCSANLNVALQRLGHYKPLVGPIRFALTVGDEETLLDISDMSVTGTLVSQSYLMTELVFLVHVARSATRETIIPRSVFVQEMPDGQAAYEAFFGCQLSLSSASGVSFSAQDAERPFLTANEAMWAIFEPELRVRMQDLSLQAGFRDRVRACLIEMLASGQCSVRDVAQKLAVSERTLQRRLREEGTSFQNEMAALRADLALSYLKKTPYTNAEIAFLLGYDDPNSFTRAFQDWTGLTPERARLESRLH